MSMHSCARKQHRQSLLFSDNLFRKVVSLLAAWAMVMSSLPAYAADFRISLIGRVSGISM